MPLLVEQGAPRVPRTGFPRKVMEAPKAPAQIPVVDDPTAQYTYAPGSTRAGMLSSHGSVTLQDIQNGYLVDSYLHQAVAKYSERIFKEGHRLEGVDPKTVEYVKARLDMMTAATGVYWLFPIVQCARDYVKFATGFLIKARMTKQSNIFGQKKKGMRRTATPAGKNKPPVGGYYAVSPLNLTPVLDSKTNRLSAWKHTVGNETVEFDLDDVIVWTYNRQPGEIYGTTPLGPVLDDVRALRQCEEMVIQLIYKSLNPLIHHEVPDTTGTGAGDQADVDAAANQHNISAVNGYIVTPPAHKINILGMESKALRAEGYLNILKHRVYAGLGLSDLIMGDATTTSSGASDAFSAVMNDRVRFYQRELADYITYTIIWELLMEGGFDPVFNEKDRVYWRFNEVDVDRRIREEAHDILLYHGNVLTEDEIRQTLNRPVLADADRQKLYLNTVQTPLAMVRSQSESVSGTGNSANSTSSGAGGDKKGAAGKPAATKQAQDPQTRFVTDVKKTVSDMILQACASGNTPSSDQLLLVVDSCARNVSALYGTIPESAINSVRVAVRATLESNPHPASARELINSLHGWLNTQVRY